MVETSKQDRMPYLLFLCENRILAQNIDGHVIDLGGLTKQNGTIDWLLDGNKEKGENLKTEIEALEDLANKIDFLFLMVSLPAFLTYRLNIKISLHQPLQWKSY